jgi:predicted class III extradiol MEMO1 family dioxygenase
MIRASPIIPPNTLPTITPTGAVGVDDEECEELVANEVVANDVVVDVEEEEGGEEAV